MFFFTQEINDIVLLSSSVQEFLPYVLGALGPMELQTLSYTKNDLILSCVYNGQVCKEYIILLYYYTEIVLLYLFLLCHSEDFDVIVDRTAGNCYTFNYKSDHTSPESGLQAGMKRLAWLQKS